MTTEVPPKEPRPVLIQMQQADVEGPQTLMLSVDTPRTAGVVLPPGQQVLGRKTSCSCVKSQPQGAQHMLAD